MMSTSPGSFSQRDPNLDYCIEGWIEDQGDQVGPPFIRQSSTRHVVDDTSAPLERSTSPSKRQRTSETDSSSGSKWVERVSRLDSEAASSFFKEPSTSATSTSRAASPTKSIRSRRIQLDYTFPAIFFGTPRQDSEDSISDTSKPSEGAGSGTPTISQRVRTLSLEDPSLPSNPNVNNDIPVEICDLIQRLSEEAANQVLPDDIISRIKKISPTEFFREPKANDAPRSTTRSHNLLKHISTIFGMARDLYAGSYDEAAWYPTIRMVLIGPPGTSSQPFVKHEEAHTRLVCSDLLPQQNGKPISTVKVDHMLQFNPGHRQIGPLYKSIFQSQPPSFSLSAFSDPIASKTFTCAVVEAKAPSGNFQEASYQIAIASAAILERVKRLDGNGGQAGDVQDFMPVVGWIVHGHFWTLHVSYRECDGSIVGLW